MATQIVKLIGQGLNNTVITGGLVPKGAYSAGTDYAVGDSVDYNGSSYVMHTDAAAGTVPTNTTYWQVLANKGDTGATGATGATGDTGAGVAAGGTANQALTKINSTDYNTQWSTVDKTFVGLGNVDNTSDASKPISTATQTALDGKATTAALNAHTSNTSNPHSVTKAQVGLGNADNTSDANKPVSTAQAAADALKVNKAGDTMTGQLANTVNTLAYRLSRASKVVDYGLDSGGNFSLFNNTDAVVPLTVFTNDTGMLIGGVQYRTGTGSPNGVVSAPVGSLYFDKSSPSSISPVWYKRSGFSNTGWNRVVVERPDDFQFNIITTSVVVESNKAYIEADLEGNYMGVDFEFDMQTAGSTPNGSTLTIKIISEKNVEFDNIVIRGTTLDAATPGTRNDVGVDRLFSRTTGANSGFRGRGRITKGGGPHSYPQGEFEIFNASAYQERSITSITASSVVGYYIRKIRIEVNHPAVFTGRLKVSTLL